MNALPFDLMNAAGWAKDADHARKIAKVPHVTHVVMGSFTRLQRAGNSDGTNFVALPDGTFGNVLGLPNGGILFLREFGREMVSIARNHGKKAVFSGAWFTPEEAGILVELAAELGFDCYEDNRGCPNVFDGGHQKVIASYNPSAMYQADEAIAKAVGIDGIEIWEKLSPYLNPEDRVRQSERIVERKRARVSVINTVPNFRPRDEQGRHIITAKGTDGFCGMSGAGVKWLGVLNAEHFAGLLTPHGIKVNGAGGIRSGGDLEDYRRVGCAGMQVGGPVYAAGSAKPLADIAMDWAIKYASEAFVA